LDFRLYLRGQRLGGAGADGVKDGRLEDQPFFVNLSDQLFQIFADGQNKDGRALAPFQQAGQHGAFKSRITHAGATAGDLANIPVHVLERRVDEFMVVIEVVVDHRYDALRRHPCIGVADAAEDFFYIDANIINGYHIRPLSR
jgi:hypothetical protein